MRSSKAEMNMLNLISQKIQGVEMFPCAWGGRPTEDSLSPEKIVVFWRLHADQLNQSSPDIHDMHHCFVWVASIQGEGTICAGRQLFRLTPGQCILVPPFQPHFYIDLAPGTLQWVFIRFEHKPCPKLDKITGSGMQNLGHECLEYLDSLIESWLARSHSPVPALLFTIILEHLTAAEISIPLDDHSTDDNDSLVNRINSYGLDNIHRSFDISELAHNLGLSESHLRSRFRKITQRSLGHHLKELRFSHACSLLHDRNLRISEVASRCGYESPYIFSRAFRTFFGYTPSAYRRFHDQ